MSLARLLPWRNSLMCKLNVFVYSSYLYTKFPALCPLVRGQGVTWAILVHNLTIVFNKLQPLVSQQQTVLAVAGKYLEAGQPTENTGTSLALLSTLLVTHLAATRVISPLASFPVFPGFRLCETYFSCCAAGKQVVVVCRYSKLLEMGSGKLDGDSGLRCLCCNLTVCGMFDSSSTVSAEGRVSNLNHDKLYFIRHQT